MRRSLLVFVGIVALATAASGCELSVVPVAARVNGQAITVSQLNDALTSTRTDAGYRCYVESKATASSSSIAIDGAGSGTFAASFAASELGFLMSVSALHQELIANGVTTGAPVAQTIGRLELLTTFSPSSSGCSESAASSVSKLAPSLRSDLIEYYSDQAALAAHLLQMKLTSEGIHQYELSHPNTTIEDCIDAVLTKTQGTANSVVNQLKKGASFAAVAKANSIDSGSAAQGGRVGCLNPQALTQPLGPVVASLKIGEISNPVKFDGEFVVLEVTSRVFPSPTNAALNIVANETQLAGFGTTLSRFVGRASVQVSSQYAGAKLSSGSVDVSALSGPPSSLVPNGTAITPASG